MDINEIQTKYENLNDNLKRALSTMEKKDTIFIIKKQITALQSVCPHNNGNYDFSNEVQCPYCGKVFGK